MVETPKSWSVASLARITFVSSNLLKKNFRGYIRSLADTFGGIPALERAARDFKPDSQSIGNKHIDFLSLPTATGATSHINSVPNPPSENKDVIKSCFRSLIQLGDLSRYRETELTAEEPKWYHAVGYYDLARTVCPTSGVPYNQLAIVSLAKGDWFSAVFWLYRARSTDSPHPQADANLQRAYTKIAQVDRDGKLQESDIDATASLLRFLSKTFSGAIVHSLGSADQVVDGLELALQYDGPNAKSVKTILVNFFVICFGATSSAQELSARSDLNAAPVEKYQAILQLTVRCVNVIFQAINSAWSDFQAVKFQASKNDNGLWTQHLSIPSSFSLNLPLLRLSMIWMVKNCALFSERAHSQYTSHISDMWALCSQFLNSQLVDLTEQQLSDVEYCMPEDESMLAFLPVQCEATKFVWFRTDGALREGYHETGDQVDWKTEQRHRARQCIQLGVELACDEVCLPRSSCTPILSIN